MLRESSDTVALLRNRQETSMISARQMIALLQSLNDGDDEQFYAIALQVAATEARRGRLEVGNRA